MSVEIKMPRLGILMESGTITCWHKREGDRVEKGEPVLDFETNKLTNTIEAPSAGVLEKTFFREGDEVDCGGVLGIIVGSETTVTTAVQLKTGEAPVLAEEEKWEGKRIGKVEPLIGARKVISTRMHESLNYSPQGTTTCRVDVTNLMAFRKAKSEEGRKYSVTDFFIKAVSLAIKQHPIMNSAQIEDKIYVYDSINIGVAVALDGNLLVPVVKESQNKSLDEISNEMKSMIVAARDNSIDMECLTGSTFTITSLGMYNVDYCTPLLNVPEAAILCIGHIRKEMVFEEEGGFKVRDMAPLSLTTDHTVMDGAPAAKFLETLGKLLAEPEKYFV